MSAGSSILKRRRSGFREANPPWLPWWLRPRFAFFLLGILPLVLAYLVPEGTYLTLYGSEKYVDLNFLMLGLVVYGGFLAGSFFAIGTGLRPQERDVIMYCRAVIWPLFIFTVFGYAAWFAYAVLLAGGPGPVVSALLDVALQPGPGTSDYVKFDLFPTIPGVTTFAQFGVFYATVEALLWVRRRSWSRIALMRFTTVALLALLRAVLLSERLAIVEIVVPVAVILFSRPALKAFQRSFVQLAPLFLGIGVFCLFAFSEYFRSWNYYKATYSGSYLDFASQRFLGYYATAINNAAVRYYYEPLQPLRYTLNDLFLFPGLGDFVSRGYAAILDRKYVESDVIVSQLLQTYANLELNNFALVGLLLNEYSVFLAPVAAFVIGLLSSSLYRSFVKGRMIGALLYPSWFVGLLEISRIYYWSDERYFPTLAFLFISLLVFKAAKVPLRGSPSARGYPQRRAGGALGQQ